MTPPSRPPIAPRRGPGWRRTKARLHRAPAPTRTRTYVNARRAWQRRLAEAGLAAVTWPTAVRRARPGADRAGHGQPGDLPRRGARDPRRDRDRDARPVPDRARHRGAEEPLPGPDAPWRRGLVSDVLRARRRIGPGGRPDPGACSTTTARWTLNGQKVWTTNAQFASFGLLLARTDPDVPKHKGLTMFIVPDGRAGGHGPRAAADLRRGRVQRGLLRRRAARRPTRSSAASATAGARR